MSTPSTATRPLQHASYSQPSSYYPDRQPYPQNIRDAQLAHPNRIGASFFPDYMAHQPPPADQARTRQSRQLPLPVAPQQQGRPQPPPAPAELPAPAPAQQRRSQRDWNEFYKNGVPTEVIVIEDSDEDVQGKARGHGDKRRRTAAGTGYGVVYTQTPYTPSQPTTTAPTSLASQASQGHMAPPLAATGQKRKRTTRSSMQESRPAPALRQDANHADENALGLYHPPRGPIQKSHKVNVPVVNDNSSMVSGPIDDPDGHYLVVAGAKLTDRYLINKQLGQGTFGKVVEAQDLRTNRKVAIKVIRAVNKYRDASKIELRVLATLKLNDTENRNRCIHLVDTFDFRNHICIVTDLYSQSVFDFLKANQFVPFPSSHIQKFARQLFASVAFLHDLKLIHTDLKPENILLVNSVYQTFTYNRTIPSSSRNSNRTAKHRRVLLDPEIRLIDFGSATFDEEYHSTVVSTRHYRAPEIILQLGWSFPCDIWSIGCILVEFFTGDALFQTHDNLEHLAMMESVVEKKFERDLVRAVNGVRRHNQANPAREYFTRTGKLDFPRPDTTKASRKYVKAMKTLREIIPQDREFNRLFLDLLRKIFVYDPAKRITAKEALQHPWFRESFADDGTEAHKIKLDRERKKREQAQTQNEREDRVAAGRMH